MWRGEPVPDGIARAVRALEKQERLTPGGTCWAFSLAQIRKLASFLVDAGIASEVIEVRDEG
jgi:hypothetical protein